MIFRITGPLFELVSIDGAVVASGELRCYHGHWTLRAGYVKPTYRGLGYQRQLIRARITSAVEHGAKRVLVWVNPRNSYSLNNLIAEDFRFMARPMRTFDGAPHVALERITS